jgi:hypothetical protein
VGPMMMARARASSSSRQPAATPEYRPGRLQLLDLQKNWRPPAGLERSRPREVRLSRAGWALLVLTGALWLGGLTAGLALEITLARQESRRRLVEVEGVDGEAEVTRLWRTGENRREHRVAYRLVAEGRTYDGRAELPPRRWRSLTVGARLPVRYHPSDPGRTSYPQGVPPNVIPAPVPYVVGLLLITIGFGPLLPLRHERRLLTEGRPARAIVTRHVKSQHGIVVHYEFAVLSGGIARGHTGPTKHPPGPGETLCVVYDAETPGKNARYPLQMVRLAR